MQKNYGDNTDFARMEEQYQKEHENRPYNKQEYAKSMHEKELAEMADESSHMTYDEKRAKRNAEIFGHGWDFARYCKEYAGMLREHEAAKAALS